MWDQTNRMGFNGNKCDALHLGSENQLYKYNRGADKLERCLCGKKAVVLVGHKLNTSQ